MVLRNTFKITSSCLTTHMETRKLQLMYMSTRLSHFYQLCFKKELLHYLLTVRRALAKLSLFLMSLRKQFSIYSNYLLVDVSFWCPSLKFMEAKFPTYSTARKNW